MPETGATKVEKTGDDKSITFRPSPNFKHMKKYLKYKFEEEGCPASLAENPSLDKKPANATNIQPPLPPNTPPADYPPNFVLKKEIVDDGYENNEVINETPSDEHEDKAKILNQVDDMPNKIEEKPKTKKEMCRDFARGYCKWDPCKHSHEIDLSQLGTVYKFCKDFANGKCKRPNCKFVHATTFEKERYHRTGYLPPHLRAQARPKDPPAAAPQQQPVPDAPVQSVHTPVFTNVTSAPDFRASCAPQLPHIMTIPPFTVDPSITYNVFVPPQPPQPPPPSPPKRDANEVHNIIREAEDAVPKNCLKCKEAEQKFTENTKEIEKIEKSTQEIKDQIALLDQKKSKLLAVLTKVLWKDMPK